MLQLTVAELPKDYVLNKITLCGKIKSMNTVHCTIKNCVILLMVMFLCACATTNAAAKPTNKNGQSAFLTAPIDYNTAHSKKDIMLIFTGSDWDEYSQNADAELFTQAFFERYGQQFDLYRIDVVRDKTRIPPTVLEQNYAYFSEYDISELPALALETKDGVVYGWGSFQSYCQNLDSFDEFLKTQTANREAIVQLWKNVKNTTGPDHSKAIDAFLRNVKLGYSSRYYPLVFEVLESDPENTSGLKKIYLLQATELKAMSHYTKGDIRAAADEFLSITDDTVFSPPEKQSCYYMAAYFLASKPENTDEVLALLQKALEIAPNSDVAPQIKSAIYSVSKRIRN